MITMNPEVVLLSLAIVLILGWCPHVQGLKCYICDSTMDSCYSSVSSKYLKDCHETAHACITSSLENKHETDKTSKRWFQRSCLYTYDYEAFGIGVNQEGKLPQIEKGELHVQKVYRMHLANEKRRKWGIEELPFPNIHNSSKDPNYSPFNRIRFCDNNFDGCNNWEGEPPFPMAEGFPIHEFKQRKTDLRCWSCTSFPSSSSGTPYSGACPDIKNPIEEWQVRGTRKSSKKALGCALHSFYQVSPDGVKPFFERDFWYPGDKWCLQKRFPSTPSATEERSLTQNKRSCGEGSVAKDTCSNGFARALTGTDEDSYSWTGQRLFHSAMEFYEFTNCKLGVRMRLGIWDGVSRSLYVIIHNDIKNFKEGPFGYVGFHFCGPNEDYCNDWSDDKLYKFMENPPTTTTTTTTRTTTQPTTTSVPVSFETTTGGNLSEKDDECCVQRKNKGNRLSLVHFAVFLPVAAAHYETLRYACLR